MELIEENGQRKLNIMEEPSTVLGSDIDFVIGRILEKKSALTEFGIDPSYIENTFFKNGPVDIVAIIKDRSGHFLSLVPPSIDNPAYLWVTSNYLAMEAPLRRKALAHEMGHWLIGDRKSPDRTPYIGRQREHIADTIADILVPEVSMGELLTIVMGEPIEVVPSFILRDDVKIFFSDIMGSEKKIHPPNSVRAMMSEGRISGIPAFYPHNALTDITSAALKTMGMKELAAKVSRWRVPDKIPD